MNTIFYSISYIYIYERCSLNTELSIAHPNYIKKRTYSQTRTKSHSITVINHKIFILHFNSQFYRHANDKKEIENKKNTHSRLNCVNKCSSSIEFSWHVAVSFHGINESVINSTKYYKIFRRLFSYDPAHTHTHTLPIRC